MSVRRDGWCSFCPGISTYFLLWALSPQEKYVAYVRYPTDIYGLWLLSPLSIMFRAELVGSQDLDRDLAVNTRSTR